MVSTDRRVASRVATALGGMTRVATVPVRTRLVVLRTATGRSRGSASIGNSGGSMVVGMATTSGASGSVIELSIAGRFTVARSSTSSGSIA